MVQIKHESIATELRKAIAKGAYPDKIPSVRDLALQYRVNAKTAAKAVAKLHGEGILSKSWGMHVRKKSTGNIGLFLRTSGHLFENFTRTLVGRLQENGRFPIINDLTSPGFRENAAMYLEQMLVMNPSSLVIETGFQAPLPRWDRLAKKFGSKTRFIFTYGYEFPEEPPATYILTDYTHGAYLAAKHLIDLGHRNIMLLTFEAHPSLPEEMRPLCYSALMLKGYRKALAEAGLSEECLCEQPFSGAPDIEERKIKHRARFKAHFHSGGPTAIIASSDFALVSHYPLLKELGLTAPRDVALIGYNNTPWTEEFEVPLTSVSIREEELARHTAEACLEDPKSRHRRIVVTPELVIRSSCGSGASVKKNNLT